MHGRLLHCFGCGNKFPYSYAGAKGGRPRKLCERCRDEAKARLENLECCECGARISYSGRGRARKRCDACQMAWEATYFKAYYAANRSKVQARIYANRRVCSGCGARLIRPAARCGFCEVEDPLLRSTSG
jgi:hypothetical protein